MKTKLFLLLLVLAISACTSDGSSIIKFEPVNYDPNNMWGEH